ncbi:MAG TPA: DUF885 domain-containing protein [Vicinamibacterales bacterium]|nr:DUF885 domain-containing protein [Vicinamibacterales bacterium]
MKRALLTAASAACMVAIACGGSRESAGSNDSAFRTIAKDAIADFMRRNPSAATYLGVHTYDGQIDDMSQAGIAAQSKAYGDFRAKAAEIDPSTLSVDAQLDREQLIHALEAAILANDSIKPWVKNPDLYSSVVTNAAYVIMKTPYAPAADRLKSLIEREGRMPAVLTQARANLSNPPEIYTQIALEQIDGNIAFFKDDLPLAFADVTDAQLKAAFAKSNADVIAALGEYKTFLGQTLKPASKGSYAYGADLYRKALAANEMVELPLDRLLDIAERDRQKNEAAFAETAKKIDPSKPAEQVLADLQKDHPPPSRLLQTTQDMLDSLRQFIEAHHIITIPPGSDPAQVKETPPFMRATTSASMDTPGPFETAKLPGRYNMTLPDPSMPPDKQEEFMHQWYPAAISNVSVHEVYPGHYVQFLYAKQFPSDVRKVFTANTNAEGWAHYCEQMMLDEGFHSDDPRYRLAQLQDALLRDVRFIAGIKMHTQGMTWQEATKLFETEGHQPGPVAESEAKRGTSDALYGYYTMGKLMILKLREDYKAKQGSSYSLEGFHDAFIKLGPLPLPLVRRAMLGATGELF